MNDMHSLKQDEVKAPRRKGFGVAPSPLNGVKLELIPVLLLSAVTGLLNWQFITDPWLEWTLIAVTGLGGAGWIVWRVRRALRHCETVAGTAAERDR